MPCNFNLRELAVDVAAGVREAGGTPMEFLLAVVGAISIPLALHFLRRRRTA